MSCCCGRGGGCCGGVSDADPNEEYTVGVFKKAIEQHNAANNESLEFVKIVRVTKQVVSGFFFRGIVEVKKGDSTLQYNCELWDKPGGQNLEVQKFEAQ